MEHTKHLWRLGGLLLVLLIAGIVSRHFAMPGSFGEMGHYRYDALFEFLEKEPVHAGQAACAECHDGEAADKAAGAHAAVQCEVCHAALATHVSGGDKVADMAIDRSYGLCAPCHERLRARPADFPQVDLRGHLELAAGAIVPAEACLECHEAHTP